MTQEVLDTSQLGSRGEIWFAGQVGLALAVLFPPGFLRPLLEGAGWLAVAAGLGLMVAGQQALGTNLTPFPKPRESGTLSTDGEGGPGVDGCCCSSAPPGPPCA